MRHAKTSSDIRVGVVGYGGAFNMGRAHLEAIRAAGMTPGAVCDIDEQRLASVQTDFPGMETYTSLADMLKKSSVNVIVIVTPHNTHAKLAAQALQAGRNVICEKPMAITTAECDRLIAQAGKNGLLLSAYHNRHWDGGIVRAIEQVVGQKAVGDVVRIEAHRGGYQPHKDWWRSSRSISGGILYDWGVHLMEYALQLLPGAKMTEVSGYATAGHWPTCWGEDTNEDEAGGLIRFDTGQWIQLSITSIDAFGKNRTRGMLEITGTEGTYYFGQKTWTLIQPDGKGGLQETAGENPPDRHVAYYENIRDYFLGKTELVITPQWARRVVHAVDLCVRSAKASRSKKTKYS